MLVVLALVLAAAMPGSAAAKEQGGVLGAFRLNASHGFRVLGLPFIGSEGRPSEILLSIGRRGESVTYSGPAEVSRTSVRADLGPIGEIDLQLAPTGIREAARSSCGKRTYHYEGAAFEGTISLHGEEGFTAVEATRTPLLVDPILDILCATSGDSEVGGDGIAGARLRLKQKAGRSRTSLQLNQNRPHGPVIYEAEIGERRGPLLISRTVSGRLPGRSFSYDDDLASAEFRAAGPFSGHAAYTASAGGSSWSGDLTVDFPGRAGTALTGPGFNASLSHARRTEFQLGK